MTIASKDDLRRIKLYFETNLGGKKCSYFPKPSTTRFDKLNDPWRAKTKGLKPSLQT